MRVSALAFLVTTMAAGFGSARAADVVVHLDGAGSSSGAPLSALIAVDVESPTTAVIRVTNTSPESSSTVAGAPVLTRVGMNLLDGPAAECFALDAGDGSFFLTSDVKPFCGVGGSGACSDDGDDHDDYKGKKGKGDDDHGRAKGGDHYDYGKGDKGKGDDHDCGKGNKGKGDDDHGKGSASKGGEGDDDHGCDKGKGDKGKGNKGKGDDDHGCDKGKGGKGKGDKGKGDDEQPCSKSGASAKTFSYGFFANNPAPQNGLFVGESVELRITLLPECAGQFELTPEAFLLAPTSPTGGLEAQWAVKFQVVGEGGEDSGCAQGNSEEPPAPQCVPNYTWSEFIATAGDMNSLPSLYSPVDGRAGSVELGTIGGHLVAPIAVEELYTGGAMSLRNGAGKVIEQWQLNRRWPSSQPFLCDPSKSFFQCWIYAATDLVDGILEATVPTFATSSNQGFDDSGLRAEIGGQIVMDHTGGAFMDNAHQTFVVTWEAPLGLDTVQILLRARYDHDFDFLEPKDKMVILFSRNVGGVPDTDAGSVVILEQTDTRLTIAVNVEAGLEDVCNEYTAMGMLQQATAPMSMTSY